MIACSVATVSDELLADCAAAFNEKKSMNNKIRCFMIHLVRMKDNRKSNSQIFATLFCVFVASGENFSVLISCLSGKYRRYRLFYLWRK